MRNFSIGNDLVNINTFTKKPERFAKRVLSSDELEQINGNWKLLPMYWAAKEAGYKLLRRFNRVLVFSPRKIVFNHQTKKIKYANRQLNCQIIKKRKQLALYVRTKDLPKSYQEQHWLSDVKTETKYSNNLASQIVSESEAVRILATRKIAKLLRVDPQAIKIKPNAINAKTIKGQPPELYFNNKKIPAWLSFSHDAGYVFVSLVVNKPQSAQRAQRFRI